MSPVCNCAVATDSVKSSKIEFQSRQNPIRGVTQMVQKPSGKPFWSVGSGILVSPESNSGIERSDRGSNPASRKIFRKYKIRVKSQKDKNK